MIRYQAAELDQAAQKHARYYVKRLSQLRELYMKDPGQAVQQVRKNLPQMRQALAWMQSQAAHDPETGQLLVRFVHLSIKFTSLLITPADWTRWLTVGVEIAEQIRQDREHLDLLLEIGGLSFSQGDLDTADQMATDCLALAQQLNDPARIGRAYYKKALVQQKLGYIETAEMQMQQAKHYYALARDQDGIGRVRSFQAQRAIDASNYDLAYDLLRENIALWHETGDLRQMAIEQYQLGVMLGNRFMHADARTYLEDARTTFQNLNERRYEAYCLQILGDICIETHDPNTAWAFIQQAIDLFTETEDQRGVAGCLNYMGRISTLQEQPEEALRYHEQAEALAREIRYYFHITEAHRAQAEIYAHMGNTATAGHHLCEAIHAAQHSRIILLLLSVLVTAIVVLREDQQPILAAQTLQAVQSTTDESYIVYRLRPLLTNEPSVAQMPLEDVINAILARYG